MSRMGLARFLQWRSVAGPLYHEIVVAVAVVPKMPALCHKETHAAQQ